MNRNSMPRLLNALIDYIADHPMSLLGRIAARRLGAPPRDGQFVLRLDSALSAKEDFSDTQSGYARQLIIAPVNYSDQARQWARAVNEHVPHVCAYNYAVDVPGGFSFSSDMIIPTATYHNDSRWQREQFNAACAATHFLIEAEEPPFGRLMKRSLRAQAGALIEAGVDVAFIAHGTDVRLPSRHLQLNEWSYFSHPDVYRPRLETVAARNIEYLSLCGRNVFVSTPDLLLDLPEARWCPVALNVDEWVRHSETYRTARYPDATAGERLRVVHAPSQPIVKGTADVTPIVEDLHNKRIIDFKLLQGIPARQMRAELAQVDVVLDQFKLGAYGVLACEAMAAGALVVGHVNSATRAYVRQLTGLELPIIEATPPTLARVLTDIADMPESERSQIRDRGRTFVQSVHDGRMSAHVLGEWLNPEARVNESVAR